MSSWYSYAALAIFVVLIFSPTWAFGKVDQALRGSATVEPQEIFTHPASEMLLVGLPSVLDREEHVLKNLQNMMETAASTESKRIWTMKYTEYLKEIRWKKLVEGCHGKSRVFLRA